MKLVGSLMAVLACAGCAASTVDDGWQITFACPTDAARSTHVLLKVMRGSCASDGESVFETRVERGVRAELPPALSEGLYGLSATAFEGERVSAFGCVLHALPADGGVRITLNSTSVCRSISDARDAGTGLTLDASAGGATAAASDSSQDTATQTGLVSVDASRASVRDGAATAADGMLADDTAKPAGKSDAGAAVTDASGVSHAVDAAVLDAALGEALLSVQLSFTGSAPEQSFRALTGGASTPDGAMLELSYDAARASGQRVQAAPAPRITLPAEIFRGDAELDAFAALQDGRVLLSTSESARLGEEPIEDHELVAYDPRTRSMSRYFQLTAVAGPTAGGDFDLDAAQAMGDGALYFSVNDSVQLHATGTVVSSSDLLLYTGTSVVRVVEGQSAWAGRDLTALAVQPKTGNFLVSLSGSGPLAGGVPFDDDDVLELSFGPGEPYASGYTVFMDGSAELSAPDGTLSALHVRD